ncbi:MAG: apolipoprotein N-acyltransferase [Fibrobacter sp.]|nr:apolipoprotein N-acyltransferase [Fibrobacter sp.]
MLYGYSAIGFLSLALDYTLRSHVGLIQLATVFGPLALYGLFRFALWNIRRFKEPESRSALAISAIGWGFYALAFPPLSLGPGALVFLVPWFMVLLRSNMQTALFASFWSGFLYNVINYYWIYNVMNVGPAVLIMIGLVLLISYFSVYNTIAAAIFVKARDVKFKGIPLLLILFPLFYAGLEMTRSIGDFSFPWSHLGYALGNQLPLLQALSLIGIFGYTALIIASNLAVAEAFVNKKKAFFATPVVIFLALWGYGAYVLSKPEASPFYMPDGVEAPKVAIVQPNIQQTNKWSKAYYDSVVFKTWQIANDSIDWESGDLDLVVFPETAIPDFLRLRNREKRWIHNLIQNTKTSIFIGALDYDREGKPPRPVNLYNSGFLFRPGEKDYTRYIKTHLVPFSERLPFDDVFPILNYVDVGQGNFVPGKERPVFEPFSWSPFICYETIYGAEARRSIRDGSRLMVDITNDGWFGKSTAAAQHLNQLRYRAIENGYPIVRGTNTGISAFVDQYGNEDLNTELYTERVITRRIPLRTRDTLYFHIGDAVEYGLLGFFFAYLAALFIRLRTWPSARPWDGQSR